MSSDKKRVAIIGTGGIAHAHVKGFAENADRATIVAVNDVNGDAAKKFAETYGIPGVYSDVETLLREEKPDLVSICTPPKVHTPLSIQSMEAGAWVLCEKPLCASLEELDEIAASENKTGRYTASVFQWRYGSAAQHLKSMFDDGSLGRAMVGVCNTTWYRDQAYYDVPWRGTWENELGGVTMGHGIHLTDLFLWLLGEWSEVKAMAGTLARNMEVEDVSSALVKFRNGAMGTVLTSVLSPRQETYLRLDFEHATAETAGLYSVSNDNWRFDRGVLLPDDADPDKDPLVQRWKALDRDETGSHPAQISRLLSEMDEGLRPGTSTEGVRPTLEFITALYKSAFTGETVHAGDIRPGDPFYTQLNGGQPKL
ncbi:MAG: Gfo/Idh/MocA family protein [Spirochaetia bacterium]